MTISKENYEKFKKDCFKNVCYAYPNGNLFEFLKQDTIKYKEKYVGYALWVLTTAPAPVTKDDKECRQFLEEYVNKNLKVRD